MPLMMLHFGQQDQLGYEDHKKDFTLKKLFLMSILPIFNNIWQNRCTIILKNTTNFFFFFFFWTMCLSDILFFIDAMILLETFFSVSCKDYLISNKISGRKLYWVSVSPDETSVKPVIKVCPWSVTTSYIP